MKSFLKKSCYKICLLTSVLLTVFSFVMILSCDKKEHIHSLNHMSRIEPNCLNEGCIEYWYCKECEKVFSDSIAKTEILLSSTRLPKLEHVIVESEGVLPLCEEVGKTAGKYCLNCNQIFENAEDIPEIGHRYDSTQYTWKWNDFTSAKLQMSCLNDSSHIKEYDATITSTTIEPTCDSSGKTMYTASVVVDNFAYFDSKEELLLPLNHQFDLDNIHWIWNGETKVYVQMDCNLDTNHSIIYEADVLVETLEPTCTESGLKTSTASITIEGKTFTNQKEEVLPVTGHAYDYDHPIWIWDDIENASIQFLCKNDLSHQDIYEASIEEETIPATCMTPGSTIYTAYVSFGDSRYSYEKTYSLPLDLDNHEWDYDSIEWEWKSNIDEYYATATVYCGCGAESKSEEAYVTSDIVYSTFQQEGVSIFKAYAFGNHQEKNIILPIKQEVSTETEFLEAIQNTSFDLTFTEDLTLTEEVILEAEVANIDLNGHTLTISEGKLRLCAEFSKIQNGYITLDDETKDYVLFIKNGTNVLLENLSITGGIEIEDSFVIIKNVALNATTSYAIHASQKAEVLLISDSSKNFLFRPYFTNTIVSKNGSGNNNMYYYIEEGSQIHLNSIEHKSKTDAALYDPSGIAPIEAQAP